MDLKSNARWLVIGGAILAILCFFLPGIQVRADMETIFAIEQSAQQTFSLAESAQEFGYIYVIPLCFAAALVLNYVYHQQRFPAEQMNMLYIGQWAAILLGVIIAVFMFFDMSGDFSNASESVNQSILGLLANTDYSVSPMVGFYLLILGSGVSLYGLQMDRIPTGVYSPADYPQEPYQQQFHPLDVKSSSSDDPSKPWIRDAPEREPELVEEPPVQIAAPVVQPPAAEEKTVKAWLVLKDGRNFQLTQGVTSIGRASSNAVQLQNPRVSGKHARIFQENGQFLLEDLGSTNGTYVNGRPVRMRVPLRNGDKLRFGDSLTAEFVRMH